ncbi:sigma-70 family RNA polymerase sigma factor [Aureibacillus halotolerans]|uniref:RNA polymerase sigma-70 factor (ECF subfamily) n=1 Tax=Aureibacillus halotolerans TaxID=1508390 RepID=A0A4R6U5L9_9BACI|nr:sigma-70 family RNA polymerase sigma factor [Aureibacillus halotolerans]TDQ39785.1 RNA polymerase sigma-70 factor (ECF subfamily) [Aureibacillus halotolerans]
MNNENLLTEQFEVHRSHLRAVAYRILGSWDEVDDAVQESWLRLSRSGSSDITNLAGWLTTVVSRVCLDMLRSRKTRREEPMENHYIDFLPDHVAESDPVHEMLLSDSIGIALLVLLDTLNPEERIAFVLHDIFSLPFKEIAQIVERSEPATRQLASRARRRIQGANKTFSTNIDTQRRLVDSFLTAARKGDFEALLTLLDPRVVLNNDRENAPEETIGARAVAKQLMGGRAAAARAALINGKIGVDVSPGGTLLLVLEFTYLNDKIIGVDVISNAARFPELDLVQLEE